MEKVVIVDFAAAQSIEIHTFNIEDNETLDDDSLKEAGFDPDYCMRFYGSEVSVSVHDETIRGVSV